MTVNQPNQSGGRTPASVAFLKNLFPIPFSQFAMRDGKTENNAFG